MEAAKKIKRSRFSAVTITAGGRPSKDDRIMVEAMVYRLRAGCPWRDLPERFGAWSSVYTRWSRWNKSGLWTKVLALLSRKAKGVLRHLDATHIKEIPELIENLDFFYYCERSEMLNRFLLQQNVRFLRSKVGIDFLKQKDAAFLKQIKIIYAMKRRKLCFVFCSSYQADTCNKKYNTKYSIH